MTKKLKPCPFCGGEAVIVEKPLEPKYSISCSECRWLVGIYFTEKEAIEAWNRRKNNE